MEFKQRMKENIRSYTLTMLLGERQLQMYFDSIEDLLHLDLLMVDRFGAEVYKSGTLGLEDIDIDNDPGRTLLVQGRTMGHFYARRQDGEVLSLEEEAFLDTSLKVVERLAAQTYLTKETTCCLDEKENGELPGKNLRDLEKLDGLTGVFNKSYYENRVKVIDRAQMAPVAVIVANINDWKYVHDHYGDDESDRLIAVIAEILKQEAKAEYVIGRVDGDVFQILITLPDDGEAEDYMDRVQASAKSYEDPILAPSVAMGLEYKTNVEETIPEKASDAEYTMFQNKFDLKNEDGYSERLKKGEK